MDASTYRVKIYFMKQKDKTETEKIPVIID